MKKLPVSCCYLQLCSLSRVSKFYLRYEGNKNISVSIFMKWTHFLGSRAYLVDRIVHYCSRKATLNISGVLQQGLGFPWPALLCSVVYSIVLGFHSLYLSVVSDKEMFAYFMLYSPLKGEVIISALQRPYVVLEGKSLIVHHLLDLSHTV